MPKAIECVNCGCEDSESNPVAWDDEADDWLCLACRDDREAEDRLNAIFDEAYARWNQLTD